MYPKKYDFTPGTKAIYLMAKTMTNCSVSSPEYFMVDEMSNSSLESLKEEYEEQVRNECLDSYRGVVWEIVKEEELPKDFFKERYDAAMSVREHLEKKIAWYKNKCGIEVNC